MTLLFLGLPLVLSRSNRNVFLAIGLCLVLVTAFMVVVMGCQYLGSSYWLEPATGRLAAADDLRAVRRYFGRSAPRITPRENCTMSATIKRPID